MEELTIRRARPDDWQHMCAAFASAGRVAWAHFLPEDFFESMDPPDRWRAAIYDPKQQVLCAVSGGIARGFAVLRTSDDEDAGEDVGEIDSFYVHSDWWGKGLGRSLVAESVARLISMGFTSATLWTAELNHRPRRIYEAAGWRLDGGRRERTLRGAAVVELRYRLDLRSAF